MTDEAAVIAPQPAAAALDVPVPPVLTGWDRVERWILVALFAFGLALPFAGAVIAAVVL